MASERTREAGTGASGRAVDGTAAPARLRWRCRRGMRELDLLMLDWLGRHWPAANAEERATFEALVDEPDRDILAWVLAREPAPERFRVLIARLAGSVSAAVTSAPRPAGTNPDATGEG